MKRVGWFVFLTAAAGAAILAAASCGGKLAGLDASPDALPDASDATSDATSEGPYPGECCNIFTGPYAGSCDHDAHWIDWDTGTVFCQWMLSDPADSARPTYCTFNGCPGSAPAQPAWYCAVDNDPSACPAMNGPNVSHSCWPDCRPNCCNGRYPGSFYDGHCCGP